MALPPRRIPAADWLPVGVDSLEPNALTVVRSSEHCSVLAGPGAGKTELLAQRAAFLLQTGASPAPTPTLEPETDAGGLMQDGWFIAAIVLIAVALIVGGIWLYTKNRDEY